MFKAVHKFFCCSSTKRESKTKSGKAQKEGTSEDNKEVSDHKHQSKENIDPENKNQTPYRTSKEASKITFDNENCFRPLQEANFSQNQSERGSCSLQRLVNTDENSNITRRQRKSNSTYTIYTSESAKSAKSGHVELFWRDPKLGLELVKIILDEGQIDKVVEKIKLNPSKRTEYELRFMNSYQRGKSCVTYAISETWIENYELYINGKRRDPPGPINNQHLKEQLKKREVPRNTYAVNELLWKFLHKLYGGGPEITYTEKAESITNTMGELDKISDTHTNDTLTRSTGYDSVRSSILDIQKNFRCNADDFIKPIRLSNPSFYCYMNSCLQALMSINQLVDHVTEGKYKSLATKESIKFWPAMAEVVHASVNREAFFSPKKLKRLSTMRFNPSEQHDAHEFLTFLLSGMQDEINLPQPPKRIEFKNSSTSWAFYKRYNLSMVDQLFAGQFNSRVTCKGCNNETVTFDPFLDLQLPIISEKTVRLDDCLEAFQCEEEIIDLYQCQKCKTTQKATKKLEIERYPKYLNIQLKRFQTYPKKQKILESIEFPIQDWKIRSIAGDTQIYNLKAAISHFGPIDSGHYVCFSKRGDHWFLCDDEDISRLSPKDLTLGDVYVLIYEKKD